MRKSFYISKILILTSFICVNSSYNALAQIQTQLWGMTRGGGQYSAGVIFNTDSVGNNEIVQYNFLKYDGAPSSNDLTQASDGKLYGMTCYGGINDVGVIFQYDPNTNTYTKKIDLSSSNGRKPNGSLIQATDGKLYGMTSNGGKNNAGVIFQYDPATNIYTKKIDFIDSLGCLPNGSLMQATDGKLYGMTSNGGKSNAGVIFQYDPATNTYAKQVDLNSSNGSNPNGTLMQAKNGKLYGMTSSGGTNNAGVIFLYDPATNIYTKKIDLIDSIGSNPNASLIQASDGRLYGMTCSGGTNNLGVIFQYNITTNTYVKEIDLSSANGGNPSGSLIQALDGKLYGMTSIDGSIYGVIFQYDISTNVYTKKFDFDGNPNGYSQNGCYPQGSLIQAIDGKLYGMTSSGGMQGNGTIFQYDTSSNIQTKKIDFNYAVDGCSPKGSLIQANNGMLYGITFYGGVNNRGVIFQFDPLTKIYSKKVDLESANGSSSSSLLQASNGKLYGLTEYGGLYNSGVLFLYDPATNIYTKKIDFIDSIGSNPNASLIQASDGKLYGMTVNGGAYDLGVLFQYDPITNICSKKVDFSGGTLTGAEPYGALTQATNGKLYGMTAYAGGNTDGVLFQYDPFTNIYIKKFDFSNANGSQPYGSLIESTNGKLYGMTSFGGANANTGTIFQYNTFTDTFIKKFDFISTIGAGPLGSLMQASDGKFYGMTKYGGANNQGVIFQYDPSTNIYNKKLDFNNTNGLMPEYTNLIEIKVNITGINDNIATEKITIYPNPFSVQSTLHVSKLFKDATLTIYNSYGQPVKQIKNISEQTITLKRNNLPSGLYFLRLSQNNRTYAIAKFVITDN